MTNDEERQEKRGFKVEDRRRFMESGDTRPDAPPDTPERSAPAAPAATSPTAPPDTRESSLPLNFSTFVLSLSTQALAHLGEIPNPVDNQLSTDLVAAQHLIDLLAILKEKTTGNLDSSESGLLDTVLYDLRLKYVERVRGRS